MKHAIIIAALLMTSASGFAAQAKSNSDNTSVNFADPGLSTKKTGCWKDHATGGDTTQARMIHADAQQAAPTFESRARSAKQLI